MPPSAGKEVSLIHTSEIFSRQASQNILAKGCGWQNYRAPLTTQFLQPGGDILCWSGFHQDSEKPEARVGVNLKNAVQPRMDTDGRGYQAFAWNDPFTQRVSWIQFPKTVSIGVHPWFMTSFAVLTCGF